MITIVLLIIIYLAFISLGLPDSLLGVTWPIMQAEWGMALDAVGLVAILITGSTIVSSFLSGHIIKKFGTGKVTFLSCAMTGGALLGFSFAPSYVWLLILAFPLGFGAGSVDTALNNYVALHFKAHHMNWLHSFWGIGATLGPLIMAQALLLTSSWRLGYRTIAFIQLVIAIILFISLPLWKKHANSVKQRDKEEINEVKETPKGKNVFKINGVKYALLTFLFYCATELSVGLWGSSFLVKIKNLPVETAASWVAMYYGGITLGRFISGFISFKLNNTQMIRLGIKIALTGTILLLLPLPNFALASSFVLIGLGLSPIFPAMIHATPSRFGKSQSQVIIGYQMGFAYIGNAFLPPLFGVVAKNTSMSIFPFYLVSCILIMFFCSERLAKITQNKEAI
ncbi:MFS transporter [Clostridium sediminicola]|uniref:MFS transporter n=1 Tax=Clostridium sediminicola TaxID=3114879 RepID=UPI0031F1C922